MFEAHSINAEHKDLIHDVAYDFYGQRMATCSSDQFVKVKMGCLIRELQP
jgi:nucleoporin SEH1